MRYPEVPEGVAPFFVQSPTETVCILYRARGPHTNKLPDSVNRLTPLAAGVAFLHPNDMEAYSFARGEVISLGRALKMYRNIADVAFEVMAVELAE